VETEKENISLRVWEDGTSPGSDTFRVTWDRNPMEENKKVRLAQVRMVDINL
jgi:hypothetical protein